MIATLAAVILLCIGLRLSSKMPYFPLVFQGVAYSNASAHGQLLVQLYH